MKTYTHIMSKREASAAILESLFLAGGTLACLPKIRADKGKYIHCHGGEALPYPFKAPVWYERRTGPDGPHFILWTYDIEVRGDRVYAHPGTMGERLLPFSVTA